MARPTYSSRVPGFAAVERAARSGSVDAVRVLVHSYDRTVRDFLDALTVPSTDAAAQHVWTRVTGKRQRSRTEREFAVQLFTVAIDTARHIHASHDPTSPNSVVRDQPRSRLVRAVRALPTDQAEVIGLRVIAGLSPHDIATITDRSASDVVALTRRAIRNVTELLDERPG